MNILRAARVKLPARILFLSLLFRAFPLSAEGAGALMERARGKELWNEPYWRALLYYEKTLTGGRRSPAIDPGFFLSPGGRTDPRGELEAAVRGFAFEGPDDASPECRFPERYRWLRRELGVSGDEFPGRTCREFEEWKAVLKPESVSLLFAAGYLNNPSTLYGHTFLRLHRKGGTDLLDYTVNYAAVSDAEQGVMFALKGLIGAYPGRFATIPYYLKVQEYHNLENRDLWEFPLDLNEEEIDRLLRHCWELGKAAFPYRFFTRNCSWQLMPLLDIVRPGSDLGSRFRFWVIPSDTAKAVVQASSPARPVWRPSLWKVVDWKRAQLSASEKKTVLELSRGDQAGALGGLEELPAERRAAVLETAADYLSWRFYARRIGKTELDARTDPLLALRARLGKADTFSGSPVRPAPVTAGHESMRLGGGPVFSGGDTLAEFRWRFAFQDLLDDPEGYLPDAALEMGSIRARYDPGTGRSYIKEAGLVHVMSLDPWDDWVRRRSWEIKAGLEQAEETGRRRGAALIWSMSGGSGAAYEIRFPVRQVWYALALADAGLGGALDRSWRLGGGAKAGVLTETGPLRGMLEARWTGYAAGDTTSFWTGTAGLSLRLARDHALRAEYSWRGGEREGGLFYQAYLFPI